MADERRCRITVFMFGQHFVCNRVLPRDQCEACALYDQHADEWEAIFSGPRPAVEGDI